MRDESDSRGGDVAGAVLVPDELYELPGSKLAGESRVFTLPMDDEGLIHVDGRFIGFGSSRRSIHEGHLGPHAAAGVRCAACRWFELRIFRLTDSGDYLMHFCGRSDVPGEVQHGRTERVRGIHEVIEVLTTRRRNPETGEHEAFISAPVARALAMAASNDEDLSYAYVNRAVS